MDIYMYIRFCASSKGYFLYVYEVAYIIDAPKNPIGMR